MAVSRFIHTISFLCLLLFLFTPGLKSDSWETLNSCNLRQVQIPAGEVASLCEAPENKTKQNKSLYSPEYVQQRESYVYPASWEDKKAAHEASPPAGPEARKPRGPRRITCKGGTAQTSGCHGILHPHSDILDPTQAAKSCTCSASSDPWQSPRITAFLSCSLASPGAVHLRQPLGDLEE